MPEELNVWLDGTHLAVLERDRDLRLSITWATDGMKRWGRGSRPLSLSLSLGATGRDVNEKATNFFDNLLPEGPALDAMAALAGVSRSDTYGLLHAFGQDCAGAVVIVPDGTPVPGRGDWAYRPLSDTDIADMVARLETVPLGADPAAGWRPSLAGFQGKLLLGRSPDGSWQQPRGGAPSTWIMKPDGRHRLAANELTCLGLARVCGLDTPDAELVDIDGTSALAVRRYDRLVTPDGPVRVHQEDFCQATGFPPDLKYQAAGGPSLRDLAVLLRDYGARRDLSNLLQLVTFNVAVGNADAHAKNVSVLHDPSGLVVRLAPAYDLLSTLALDLRDHRGQTITADPTLGQNVGGVSDVREVRRSHLFSEGTTWGLSLKTATTVVNDTLERLMAGVAQMSDIAEQRVADVVLQQVTRLLTDAPGT